MATIPTRPQTAEYITAVRNITQVLTESWRLITSEPANSSRELIRLRAELRDFQTRFQVTLMVIVGDSLFSLDSVFLRLACPISSPRFYVKKFIQDLPRVSITSLLGDDNIVPKCSICLKPFTENMAQAPLTNDNGENQPRSAELPAETADSIDIPVRLPCGHVFGRECIYSWITSCRGENPPTCPLCRVVLECVCNSLTIGGEFYVEVIRVQCPEILNSDRDMNALLDLIMAIHEESV